MIILTCLFLGLALFVSLCDLVHYPGCVVETLFPGFPRQFVWQETGILAGIFEFWFDFGWWAFGGGRCVEATFPHCLFQLFPKLLIPYQFWFRGHWVFGRTAILALLLLHCLMILGTVCVWCCCLLVLVGIIVIMCVDVEQTYQHSDCWHAWCVGAWLLLGNFVLYWLYFCTFLPKSLH